MSSLNKITYSTSNIDITPLSKLVQDSKSYEFPRYAYINKLHFRNKKLQLAESKVEEIACKINAESKRIFEEITATLGTQTIPIIGYGSLMNPDSAKVTISSEDAVVNMEPVRIPGYERVFNVNLERDGSRRRRENDGDKDWAVLNIQKSDSKSMNAVVLNLDLEDFQNLRQRERAYSLVPVMTEVYTNANVVSQPQASIAYAWIVTDPNFLGTTEIKPIPLYYRLVAEALSTDTVIAKFGEKFFEDYLDTTALANGTVIRTVHDKMMQATADHDSSQVLT